MLKARPEGKPFGELCRRIVASAPITPVGSGPTVSYVTVTSPVPRVSVALPSLPHRDTVSVRSLLCTGSLTSTPPIYGYMCIVNYAWSRRFLPFRSACSQPCMLLSTHLPFVTDGFTPSASVSGPHYDDRCHPRPVFPNRTRTVTGSINARPLSVLGD